MQALRMSTNIWMIFYGELGNIIKKITNKCSSLRTQGTNYSRPSLSRIPRDSIKYFEISVPRHIRVAELRKKLFEQPHLTNIYLIGLMKLEIYWKYCRKEEKLLLRSNFSSFPQYFFTCCKMFMFRQGPDFHFEISGFIRDKRGRLYVRTLNCTKKWQG